MPSVPMTMASQYRFEYSMTAPMATASTSAPTYSSKVLQVMSLSCLLLQSAASPARNTGDRGRGSPPCGAYPHRDRGMMPLGGQGSERSTEIVVDRAIASSGGAGLPPHVARHCATGPCSASGLRAGLVSLGKQWQLFRALSRLQGAGAS